MLELVALVAVLATALPSPLPSPTQAPPLHEIAHVRASAFCAAFAAHVNGAIDAAMRNDTQLSGLVGSLKHADLTPNSLAWHSEVNHLTDISDAVTLDWKNGEREVGQLRDLAVKADDPAEKKELTDAADALGGALWRQRTIARDLDGFIAYLDTNDMMTNTEDQSLAYRGILGTSDPVNDPTMGDSGPKDTQALHEASGAPAGIPFPGAKDNPSDQSLADSASRDFAQRLQPISLDELTAAVHVEQASEKC